jgi:hypothetical protein
MDTIESNVPVIDGGQKYTQLFVGTISVLTNIYSLKSISMIPSILSDQIIDCSVPTHLLSDRAKVEMSKQVKDILCTYGMGCWQGHSTKCQEFDISRKNFKNRTGFHQVRFHCWASLSGKIGNYQE